MTSLRDPYNYRKRLYLRILINSMLLFFLNLCLIYCLLNVSECMFRQYVALCVFKAFLTHIYSTFVFHARWFVPAFFIEDWSSLRSLPISHRIISLFYIISFILLFSYIVLSPLWFDYTTIDWSFASISKGPMSCGCSEHSTVER
jgi:hypothetical protein